MYVSSLNNLYLQQSDATNAAKTQIAKLDNDADKKFKAHYREIERENRFYDREREKEQYYETLLRKWELKEKEIERKRKEKLQKEAEKDKELAQRLEDDLNYDSADDKHNKISPLYSKHSKGKRLSKYLYRKT